MFRWWWSRPVALASGRRAEGEAIEAEAARWLQRQGLRVIERNYSIRGGEIDLIARDGASVVFVEVRYRQAPRGERAVDSVGPRKQRLLLRCAAAWLAAHPDDARRPCRFDVLGVHGKAAALEFQWIRDAFRADRADRA